ncbi:MAG: alpha-amylase family glycosyl hydrolase [Pseudomonadota bacterium]
MKRSFSKNCAANRLFALGIGLAMFLSCALARAGADLNRPIIYQLVVRHFGNEVGLNKTNGTLSENGVGKFIDINDEALTEIKKWGVTHIWLTGVFRQSTLTDYSQIGLPSDDPDIVKGRAGSFYAIKDYFDVCPDYAVNPKNRLLEFKDLVRRIHSHGMKVMVDLVGNHVARSYQSLQRPDLNLGVRDDQYTSLKLENNFVYLPQNQQSNLRLPLEKNQPQVEKRDGLYERESGLSGSFVKATGNRLLSANPTQNSWYETILLNYGFDFLSGRNLFNTGSETPANSTWEVLDEFVRTWTADYGVDGFRADFAHWIPNEFWTWLIKRARARSNDLLFVAEAYENKQGLVNAGFDAVYDDPTYDTLKGISNQTALPTQLENLWFASSATAAKTSLRYLENHDERRLASPLNIGSNPDESGFGSAEMASLVGPLTYLSGTGPILIYNGQTEGEEGSGQEGFDSENGRTSLFDYWTVPALAKWRNGGSYDGGGLSGAAKKLQIYYRNLLNLAQTETFQTGKYYGLNYVNRGRQDFPQDKVFVFARYNTDQKQLMIVLGNWLQDSLTINLSLPENLMLQAGLDPGRSVKIQPILIGKTSAPVKSSQTIHSPEDIPFTAVGASSSVFRITQD